MLQRITWTEDRACRTPPGGTAKEIVLQPGPMRHDHDAIHLNGLDPFQDRPAPTPSDQNTRAILELRGQPLQLVTDGRLEIGLMNYRDT